MGLLSAVAGPLVDLAQNSSTAVLIAATTASMLTITVVLNVLQQLLFRNPNEPPVVFHLFPILGSTVVYGMDPYKFFFSCREKV